MKQEPAGPDNLVLCRAPGALAVNPAGIQGVHRNLLSSGRMSKVQGMAVVVNFNKGFGKGQL